jgi:hypothetical protein
MEASGIVGATVNELPILASCDPRKAVETE